MGFFIFGVLALTALILWALAAWMVSTGRREKALWALLAQQGVETEGEVTQRLSKGQGLSAFLALLALFSNSHTSPSTVRHFVVVKFEVPDGERKKVYTIERPVGAGNALAAGNKVQVHYLPSSPINARLSIEKATGKTSLILAGVIAGLGALMMVMGVVLGMSSERDSQARDASRTAFVLRLSATANPQEKTATVYAAATTTAHDANKLALIHADFEDKLPEWQKVTDLVPHRLDSEVKNFLWVDYGYCAPGKFYAVFWERITDRITINNELSVYYAGYGYYKGTTPDECYPNTYSQIWSRRQNPDLGDGWYAIEGARRIKVN